MATTNSAIAQEQALVPTFIATIGGIEQTCVDARFLHAYLQNGDMFAHWINARLQKYGFEQGTDYELIAWEKTQANFASQKNEAKNPAMFASVNAEAKNKGRGGHNKKDYRISLDMAKELSMVENNDRGREARRYFIAMERKALGLANAVAQAMRPEPRPAPTSAREKLNASDMQHIKRVVWFAARNFHRENAACQGIWHHLREVTYNPAPNAYSVDHIPVLAAELRRIASLCEQVGQITRHVEEQAVKRIFRKGETAEKVLSYLARQAASDVQKLREGMAEFPTWMEADLIGFTERQPARFINHYEPEQPDFFLGAA